MEFSLITSNGTQNLSLDYRFVFAVGYTGRDTEKTLSHIRELETDLGVPAPARIPTIFLYLPIWSPSLTFCWTVVPAVLVRQSMSSCSTMGISTSG